MRIVEAVVFGSLWACGDNSRQGELGDHCYPNGTCNAQAMFYAENIHAMAASANTVSVTFSAVVQTPDVRILEYRGIASADALDVSGAMTGSGTAVDSGAVVTRHAHDLIVAGASVQNIVTQPDPSYTERIVTNPGGNLAEDLEVNEVGMYSAKATQAASGTWVMQIAAFKGA